MTDSTPRSTTPQARDVINKGTSLEVSGKLIFSRCKDGEGGTISQYTVWPLDDGPDGPFELDEYLESIHGHEVDIRIVATRTERPWNGFFRPPRQP